MPVYQLIFLENNVALVDAELLRTFNSFEDHPDPDMYGLYDHYETVIGIGAVIVQRFLVSVHKGNRETLTISPIHFGGKSYVQLVNSCANYWKHKDEWNMKNLAKNARNTIATLESVGVSIQSDYPLSNCMHCILGENSAVQFSKYLPYLEEWSNVVAQ